MRMVAGATLTLIITAFASHVGARWSGVSAVFPILGSLLAVFSHRAQGARFAAALLRAMATGMYSFAAFCFVLSIALRHMSIPMAFMTAVIVSLAVQIATKRYITSASSR